LKDLWHGVFKGEPGVVVDEVGDAGVSFINNGGIDLLDCGAFDEVACIENVHVVSAKLSGFGNLGGCCSGGCLEHWKDWSEKRDSRGDSWFTGKGATN
jgi:hypothetical protein